MRERTNDSYSMNQSNLTTSIEIAVGYTLTFHFGNRLIILTLLVLITSTFVLS